MQILFCGLGASGLFSPQSMHRTKQPCSRWASVVHILTRLESERALDVNNDTDIFCFCVLIPCTNNAIEKFVFIQNQHKIFTENNYTPKQIFWIENKICRYILENLTPTSQLAMHWKAIRHRFPQVCVPDTLNLLGDDDQSIYEFVTLFNGRGAIDAYWDFVSFVGEKMM